MSINIFITESNKESRMIKLPTMDVLYYRNSTGSDDDKDPAGVDQKLFFTIFGAVVGGLLLVSAAIFVCVNWESIWEQVQRNFRIGRYRRRRLRPYVHNSNPMPNIPSYGTPPPSRPTTHMPSRKQQMLKNFKFQSVLPDKSNIDPKVLWEEDIDDLATNNDDSDSVIQLPKDEKAGKARTNRNWSKLPFRSLLSTWRRPTENDECAICLQGYEAGQTICTAKTTQCNHVFHQDCMEEWLKDHDSCPMCRVNLMDSASDNSIP
eukprot:scaffold1772_cov80-Cylindrotheca_fusiformis.AAC.13